MLISIHIHGYDAHFMHLCMYLCMCVQVITTTVGNVIYSVKYAKYEQTADLNGNQIREKSDQSFVNPGMYIIVYMCMYVCVYVCICVHHCVHVHVCMRICMHICMQLLKFQ